MGAPAILKVDMIADASKATREVDKLTKTGGGIKSWAKGAAAAVGAAFAVDKIRDFVNAGAELQDNIGASQQIFGSASKSVVAWSKTTASSLGISQTAALDAANTFAAFGKGAGLTGKDLASFSGGLVGLASDLSSFRGGSTEQAINAVGAALRGESEPIRAYGVLLDDATIKARAMSMGLVKASADTTKVKSAQITAVTAYKKYNDEVKKHGENSAEARIAAERLKVAQAKLGAATKGTVPDLTQQQKVMAAQAEIFAQTSDAQGDFERTSDSAANQQKILKAQMEDVQSTIGTALLPVIQKLLPYVSKLAKFVQDNVTWLMPFAVALGVLAVAFKIAGIASQLFGVSMWSALWPVLLVIAAIAALIAITVLIVKNWDTIKAAAAAVWHAVQVAWDAILNTIKGVASAIWQWMQGAWDKILGAVKGVWNWIARNWPMILAILTGPIGIAVLMIVRNWDTIKQALAAFVGWLRGAWSAVTHILTAPFRLAWDGINTIVGWIHNAIDSALSFARNTASSIANAIKGPLNAVIRAWNRLEFKVPEVSVGPIHFGGQTIGLPDIPELASGGTVRRTGLALVHAGENWSGVGASRRWSPGGSTVVNITVTTTGLGADAPQIQRAVVNALRGYTTRNGPLDVPVRQAG